MDSYLYFKVDPRLVELLWEEYKSSEKALKELVDNAWDADADNVHITLPQKLNEETITIRDDGVGMSDKALSTDFLTIARNKRLNGERTPRNRKIKGRRGVGKFAGLTIADCMAIDSKKNGHQTILSITKEIIIEHHREIGKIKLPIHKTTCSALENGTLITLTKLNQLLALPDPEKLKRLLSLDYGRELGFKIYINGEQLALQDYPGPLKEFDYDVPEIGQVNLRLKILDTPNRKNSGAFFRLNSKFIDDKDFLGLEESEEFSDDIRHRFIGEVNIESQNKTLSGNSGSLNRNSKALREIKKLVIRDIINELKEVISSEMDTRIPRIIASVDNRIAVLSPNRKSFFNSTLDKLIFRFHKMAHKNIGFIVSLILDALEYNDEKE